MPLDKNKHRPMTELVQSADSYPQEKINNINKQNQRRRYALVSPDPSFSPQTCNGVSNRCRTSRSALMRGFELISSHRSPASLASSHPLYQTLFLLSPSANLFPLHYLFIILASASDSVYFLVSMFQISASRPIQIANTIRHKKNRKTPVGIVTSSLTNEPSAPQVQWLSCFSSGQHLLMATFCISSNASFLTVDKIRHRSLVPIPGILMHGIKRASRGSVID